MEHVSKKPKLADGEDAMDVDDKETVSYTHLTLPTILRV